RQALRAVLSRYAAGGTPVAIVMPYEITTFELLAGADKANALPIAEPQEDFLVASNFDRIRRTVRDLRSGTILLTPLVYWRVREAKIPPLPPLKALDSSNEKPLDDAILGTMYVREQQLVVEIRRTFRAARVASLPDGLLLLRLDRLA